ncbi:O-antigen ligase family protein [Micromonospora sp. NPDC049004]|uniref:O-antigen ligase family protein n=1 Tax=unclassified Micromonospora TaxID=2617518 RepID=UPI00340F799C
MTGSLDREVAPGAGPTEPSFRPISAFLSTVIVVVVGALLVHVLLETWAQVLTGPTSEDPRVNLDSAAQWPKQLKTALYLGLAALTVAKVATDRLWHRFRTGADLALVALGLVMVLTGVVNDSSTSLMGEALFVYFRGVIVFYALRAAELNQTMIRRLLLVVAAVVGVNVLLALVQMVVGRPAYRALGWVDLTWADQSRAQGLLSHPNHLGHVLGLTLLGVVAWVATTTEVRRRWWVAGAVIAVAMSATQSRETLLGVLIGAAVVAVVVRSNLRRILAVCLLVVLCTVTQIAVRPDNRAEWERRIGNAFSSFNHPAGSEPSRPAAAPGTTPGPPTVRPSAPVTAKPSTPATGKASGLKASVKPSSSPRPGGSASPRPGGSAQQATSPRAVTPTATRSPAPVREIRVLYLQQAANILPRQPVLGFGIGQFGGVVAEKNNPNWHKNPKLGPGGFNRYGFQAVQVDSFWLHLIMEVGVLGFATYLVWLFLVARPLLSRPRHLHQVDRRIPPTVLWGIAALVFACIVGFFSPSMEDPLLPPLLWTVVGLAWWAERQPAAVDQEPDREGVAAAGSGRPAGAQEAETLVLATDEILATARQMRPPTEST